MSSLEIPICDEPRDITGLDIDLTAELTEADVLHVKQNKGLSEQDVYRAISKHLHYLNEVIIGLLDRVKSSLRRMDYHKPRSTI